MPNGDPWDGFFYPSLTHMIDSFMMHESVCSEIPEDERTDLFRKYLAIPASEENILEENRQLLLNLFGEDACTYQEIQYWTWHNAW